MSVERRVSGGGRVTGGEIESGGGTVRDRVWDSESARNCESNKVE